MFYITIDINYHFIYFLYDHILHRIIFIHLICFSIKAIKRDPESIMTDVIVNIGGDSMDESNLIAKFGKSDNIPMCKQVSYIFGYNLRIIKVDKNSTLL